MEFFSWALVGDAMAQSKEEAINFAVPPSVVGIIQTNHVYPRGHVEELERSTDKLKAQLA